LNYSKYLIEYLNHHRRQDVVNIVQMENGLQNIDAYKKQHINNIKAKM